MILSQTIVSLLSLFSFISTQRIFDLKYTAYLAVLSFFEFFLYKWILMTAKICGTFDYLRGVRVYDQYARPKL